jgi:hypothetical protein
MESYPKLYLKLNGTATIATMKLQLGLCETGATMKLYLKLRTMELYRKPLLKRGRSY